VKIADEDYSSADSGSLIEARQSEVYARLSMKGLLTMTQGSSAVQFCPPDIPTMSVLRDVILLFTLRAPDTTLALIF
jgi:hypothetical protein